MASRWAAARSAAARCIVAVVAALLGAPQSVVRSLLEGGGEVTETPSGRAPSAAEDEAADFVKVVLGSTEDVWTEVLPARGAATTCRRSWCCSPTPWSPPAASPAPRSGRSTARPIAGVPGSVVLRRARPALRRARRLRAGVRGRARGRPPRAEPARHLRTRARPARGLAPRRPTGSRWRPSCRPTAWPASGRSTPTATRQLLEPGDVEEGLTRRRRDRRRHAAEGRARAGRPRVVHARLVRAARALVPARDVGRPGCRLRHLRGRGPPDPPALTFPCRDANFRSLRGSRMVGASAS